MIVTCKTCLIVHDDAQQYTYCPHDKFLSDDQARQKDLGLALIGKEVWFAHLQKGDKHCVTSVNFEGMVSISDMTGWFAPHIFVLAK